MSHIIKYKLLFVFIALLIYTRFIGLGWGLPYPFHPDERNMANAIQSLNCTIPDYEFSASLGANKIQNCFNPRFFAYGQFPLYAGYAVVFLLKFFDGDMGTPISYSEAVLALRIISAIASVLAVFVLMKIVEIIRGHAELGLASHKIPKQVRDDKGLAVKILPGLLFLFSPGLIQFAHFGTTESLLMLFYTAVIYVCLLRMNEKASSFTFLFFSSFLSGLAIATKVSSFLFLFAPLVVLLLREKKENRFRAVFTGIVLILVTAVISVIFSPFNIIDFREFLGSMRYETSVAAGGYIAFYTRQFVQTIPILFQGLFIFPYVLGIGVFVCFLLGFIVLPRTRDMNFLRFAFLVFFLPQAFLFAKWTRFMAPVIPLMLVFSVIFICQLQEKLFAYIDWINSKLQFPTSSRQNRGLRGASKIQNFSFLIFNFSLLLPGLAFLSIYHSPDVRFQASEWIYKNIPSNSYILSETANVVDIPVLHPKSSTTPLPYQIISFDFYNLDTDVRLQKELEDHVKNADYIIVPSRRVFENHYCGKLQITNNKLQKNLKNQISNFKRKCQYVKTEYPLLNKYYSELFNGELGFEKVAEFSSYPKIRLFGKTLIEFPDEKAEETFSVFDHPVIRVYKRR